MFSATLNPQRFEHRRLKYLRVIYLVCTAIILFFILRYNFEYHLSSYNAILFPAFFFLLGTPFVYKWSQSYKWSAAWVVFWSSSILMFFLYTSGGIQAPGIFWLTSIPITGGILYGRRGGFLSALGMAGIFVIFLVLEQFTTLPNIVEARGIYRQEKFINLICFLFYSLLTTYYFIRNEDIANNEILNNKEDLENFMRILIHDIANPVAFIQGGLEEIQNPQLGADDKAIIISRMQKNTENILSILNQVRQLKALQDGKIELSLSKTDVALLIKDILANQSGRIQEKSLQVTVQLENCCALADSLILQNVVLSNLISNAIKFSHPHGNIVISLNQQGSHVLARIQDDGIGIPANIKDKLFSMTTTTTRSGTLGEKGTGYGLPLAREYVLRMKGDLTITSREQATEEGPRGTTVTLTLPAAPSSSF